MLTDDTIVARATALGRASVGIVRISGKLASIIAEKVTRKKLIPRYATFAKFIDQTDSFIDEGLALFFPAPNSFTGEDVVELQCHGSPIVIQSLVEEVIQLGARAANPGEFSLRAFLNGKLDLLQAEAIADLINSDSKQAARSAVRSLQGVFSEKIHLLVSELIALRTYVEAAIDFPDEELDLLADGQIQQKINHLIDKISTIKNQAYQGSILRDGITIVIVGEPNVGKSSLLNCLSGRDIAIVTDVPGTTRDVMREQIIMDGIPLHIMDTAGLRVTTDIVEQEGIKRALKEIEQADQILFITDKPNKTIDLLLKEFGQEIKLNHCTVIQNKIDLRGEKASIKKVNETTVINLSAKTGEGIDLLKDHIKQSVGFTSSSETTFIARNRHINAISLAEKNMQAALKLFSSKNISLELIAEELRLAQLALSEITGQFTTEDLLGSIFSSFCIGK